MKSIKSSRFCCEVTTRGKELYNSPDGFGSLCPQGYSVPIVNLKWFHKRNIQKRVICPWFLRQFSPASLWSAASERKTSSSLSWLSPEKIRLQNAAQTNNTRSYWHLTDFKHFAPKLKYDSHVNLNTTKCYWYSFFYFKIPFLLHIHML